MRVMKMIGTMNLYPYNRWVLRIALIILVVCLIVTALKAKPLMGFAKEYKPTLDHISEQVETSKAKAQYLEEWYAKQSESKKPYLKAMLLFHAINKSYKKEDGHGVKAFGKAATDVLTKEQRKKAVISSIKEFM